ncbi:hypothetical protein E4K67_22270 [Desulfosporosinus fructosivorans]|uniref:Uncharacterized protein n=1 Tax=Desulfosporosinus fructosivorans TaxID=2018669 RepID=A0A4Z0QZZ3_9FIRM|nr:hypothetical protein [Desulfosporosinus fructosivorans]TGE35849.1 hypothetical protein E4K67_22270 [Desulfosporosinus fructosivorans]
MFIVLRKQSIKRTLALSILLIISGYTIANPISASASNKPLTYLYPYANNNPVEVTGLFWLESTPEMGAYPLAAWTTILSNKMVVVGIPENQGYMMGSSMIGDKLGKYIVYRIKNKLTATPPKELAPQKATSPPKDSFVYKRTVGDVTEEIKVDVGEHFKDNDSFRKFMDTVKKNLTSGDLIKETNKNSKVPAPSDKKLTLLPDEAPAPEATPEAAKAVGNTLMLGGAALMLLKLLPLLAL